MGASPHRLLLLILLLTIAFNVVPSADEFWLQTYDGETHLFFADHYRRGWWDAWEEKWMQGFWVYGYPPLVHQLIALIGRLSSVEVGYRVVQLSALAAYPLGAWLLAREILGADAADHAALLTIAPAGLYLALYSFGQLPTIVGFALMLFALTLLARYVRDGLRSQLLGWACLAGAVFGAHHFTAIFGLLPAAAGVALHRVLGRREPSARALLARLAAAGVAMVAAGLAAILPFWWWSLTQRGAVAEIAHPTRLPFLQIPEFRDLFFLRTYGASALLLPLAVLWFLRGRSRWPLAALMIAWIVLGFGGNTPVPRLMLGSLWTYLVYDRFALLAALFAPLAAGDWLAAARSRVRWAVLTAVLVPAVVVSAGAAVYTRTEALLPALQPWERMEMQRFLDAENHAAWYYLTLGLGDNEFQHLSRLVAARTIDGYYSTARTRRELRDSGIGSFDATLHFSGGSAVLRSVLERPEAWSLKWALVRDARYDPLLEETGWRRAYPLGSDQTWRPGDPMHSTVMIWYVPAQVPVIAEAAPDVPAVLPWLWGLVPLTLLAAGLVLFVRALQKTPA
jgi:hypothetical protein